MNDNQIKSNKNEGYRFPFIPFHILIMEEIAFDIYSFTYFDFKFKLPVVFVGRGSPEWNNILLIIVILLIATYLNAEDAKKLTGRERREQVESEVPWDDWYSLTLPCMNAVIVEIKEFSFNRVGG